MCAERRTSVAGHIDTVVAVLYLTKNGSALKGAMAICHTWGCHGDMPHGKLVGWPGSLHAMGWAGGREQMAKL